MFLKMRLVEFITVLLLVFSCEGKKKEKKSLNVLTYNVWFTESDIEAITTKKARKKKIISALKKSDADLVCLQEVFTAQDVEDIVDGVQKNFPYSFSGVHKAVNKLPPQKLGKRRPPCDYTRLSNYIACATSNGCTVTTDINSITACVLSNCLPEVQNIFLNDNQACRNCITTSSFNIAQCAAEKPVVGGRQMNEGCLVLLSKKKLRDASFNEYYPKTRVSFTRGYIEAEVEDIATVRCTHLSTSTFQFFEPELSQEGFTSYDEMNAYEARTLIKSLRGIQPAIIMGGFNSGLAFTPKLVQQVPESYQQLLKRFTTRPALQFTHRNPPDRKTKSVIDHVFVKNLIIRKTKRVFVPKEGEAPMSDHVGVQSVVKAAQ
ncbi:uncharacterized protein LOC123552295 isoform X2 [Mercenaria mercenaria]|uniref:uncharacterized protein LOC123552295 isoform X2 n=1 Tax=Mercenaria mercenaria TaxID=6596 RepID=UPI001E1DD67D|nr:uncharacterized protein LOC123552295 isoform X2 [Mercenaria mercenaria]